MTDKTDTPSAFSCQQCGNCCKGEGDVFVTPEDAARIADYLEISLIDFYQEYTYKSGNRPLLTAHPNQDCIFLKENKCLVHDVKPTQCLTWPYWPELLGIRSNFEYAQSYCPGLKPFTFEQFKK